MYREGQLESGGKQVYVGRVLLDTGASSGSYIGQALVDRFHDLEVEPCSHRVRLSDNKTEVHITQYVTLEIALYDEKLELTDSIFTELYVMPNLGNEVIIGLPDILGNYYDYFIGVLENARRKQCKVERLYALYGLARKEAIKYKPSPAKLKRYASEAKKIGSWYVRHKQRIKGSKHSEVYQSHEGTASAVLYSEKFGTAFADDRIE